jgi:hypothetical protein
VEAREGNEVMAAAITYLQECLAESEYSEVAYRRIGLGVEAWDITSPDEDVTVRLCDNDGQIEVYLFTGGKAQICSGQMTFRHALAAPAFVAQAVDQIIADYIL